MANCCCHFVIKKPELDLVHMDFLPTPIFHIFSKEWHLKTKERSQFVIGVKAPFRWTTSVFFSSRCCHCDYTLVNWSVKVEVFRSPASRGPRSDLVLVPLFRFFCFPSLVSFSFLFDWGYHFPIIIVHVIQNT